MQTPTNLMRYKEALIQEMVEKHKPMLVNQGHLIKQNDFMSIYAFLFRNPKEQ